ncbi:hypothetical protein F5Y06DRAFT_301294 [Hypoxylon sp. FL0890]|nr:hypothetical protein F5Y06DRAFT_301294 [Hypoxylon sp. FL0890]
MSAAHPELLSTEKTRRQRYSRSRSRSRPKPQPASKSKKRKLTHATVKDDPEDDDGWFAIRDIIDEKLRRGKRYYLVDWEGTDKNGHPHKPSWEPEKNVTAAAIDAWRQSIKNRPQSAPAPSRSTYCGPAVTKDPEDPKDSKYSLQALGGLDSDNVDRHTSGRAQEVIEHPRTSHIVVELSRDPLFDVNTYLPVPSDSQQTAGGSQQSSQPASTSQTQTHRVELENGQQRVIPDSQAISGISLSELQDTIPDPQRSLVTSQGRGEVTKSQQSSSRQQPNFPSHSTTTTIPSHQIDGRIVGTLANLSSSAFVIETDPGSVDPNNSQSSTSRGDSSFLTRENTHHNVYPDEFVSVTSVSQNQTSVNSNSFTSQQSNSQAAQIVQPLSSQQGGLVTRSHSNFTVYDEDSVVPDTEPKDPQFQHDSQDSSQALSELDGNTRSTSSSKGHQRGSQPVPSCVELSQSHHRKPANSDETEESPIRQLASTTSGHPSNPPSTPQQQAAPAIMETPGTPVSLRERLRLIRERNFASLPGASPSLTISTDTNQVDAHHGNTQEVPALQPPVGPEISPITPIQVASPSFLTQPLEIPQNEPPIEEQSSVAEAVRAPDEREGEPATLDPSTLTLSSIEGDTDVQPSVGIADLDAFALPHEEEQTPPNYPKGLLPYVPTGPNEYLITLPFYNNSRPVYNDVIRESGELIDEFTACFLASPRQKPHPTTVLKLDEMLSRLFDICDFPTFMETIPYMTPSQITKHAIGTNAKFAFVDELLTYLADVKSDKKILILVRPGKLMDLLGTIMQTKGYRCVRSGQEIVSASNAQHALTVVISSTLDGPSSIPEDIDAIIAFDHTYRPELLPSSVRERSPVLMVLANICSIQHLNMRVSEKLELLERKNILVLALVKATRYVEGNGSEIYKLHKAAEKFADYIQDPDDDDFYWESQEIPEDVFEDVHIASGLDTEQNPGSRKRSHDTEAEETSSKRPRVSQPTVVTNVSHISDALKGLIGDDSTGDSPKAVISVPVDKLEALSTKIASLESQVQNSKEQEELFRQLSDRSQRETEGYRSSLDLLRTKYMTAMKDLETYEDNYYKAKEELTKASKSLESSKTENADLKEKNAELQKQLSKAKDLLLNSSNPGIVLLEKELERTKSRIQQLEKKVGNTEKDLEYAKNAYQDASKRAAELNGENRVLEQRVEALDRKAKANVVEVNRIYAASESEELLRLLNEQKLTVRDRDAELSRLKDELKTLKESRRTTRQSSAPHSPRLPAFNSPRNGGRGKGGSSSRGTSPAPPPTGVFETGAGSGTPAPNNRASHLRESRF